MTERERHVLENAVQMLADQAAKADDLVDEATAAGGGSHPVTVHAKMLRLSISTKMARCHRSSRRSKTV
jgi:hypothetical protein